MGQTDAREEARMIQRVKSSFHLHHLSLHCFWSSTGLLTVWLLFEVVLLSYQQRGDQHLQRLTYIVSCWLLLNFLFWWSSKQLLWALGQELTDDRFDWVLRWTSNCQSYQLGPCTDDCRHLWLQSYSIFWLKHGLWLKEWEEKTIK